MSIAIQSREGTPPEEDDRTTTKDRTLELIRALKEKVAAQRDAAGDAVATSEGEVANHE